ncbi:DUF2115 domain-containing protein [Methanogenium organophilum]|uniref:UPF0305 protein OU421_04805 n=1 Tax=Methanogenium organophilum TaxID=2199 RepID=A0A9X9S647_METOG|nr:DUF2115 domain-containing protein [Methanogenium organophilum]WAI02196.1 DUF2115 domain-containing protein [Methanogenium organophilum]
MTEEGVDTDCSRLALQQTRGDLGREIAAIVLRYSPRDLKKMQWNFSGKIRKIDPIYRKKLEKLVTGHLLATWEDIRLMNQQGAFAAMREPVPETTGEYWTMVAENCSSGEGEKDRLRFLKFLLAGFCMFVRTIPPHPVGMPFPGGDTVQLIEGTYYCPVRTKANDVDSALCPFCPAHQTPEVGYLKPPVKGSTHRKQEFIRNTYEFHHFNG